MRCCGGRCAATFTATVASYSVGSVFCGASLRCRRGVNAAAVGGCRRLSTDGSPTDVRTVLQQLRRRFSRNVVEAPKGEGEKERELDTSDTRCSSELSLRQIVACCEKMCHSGATPTLSAGEWGEAVRLLLRVVAEAKRDDGDDVAVSLSPWDAALRLFLHPPPSSSESNVRRTSAEDVTLCVTLLRCCVRHDAPVLVSRAVYQTLRSSVVSTPTAATGESGGSAAGWHLLYSRFLLKTTTSGSSSSSSAADGAENAALLLALHKEALRVLLLDAAEDGEELRPAGLLLSLELLRRVVTRREETNKIKEGAVEDVASSTLSSLLSPLTSERPLDENAANDILWSCLQTGTIAMGVARDVCCRVMRNPHLSLVLKQEAFCRFVAVGMWLSAEETHPLFSEVPRVGGEVAPCAEGTPRSYAQFFDALSDLLSISGGGGGSCEDTTITRKALVRVLVEPCVTRHSRQMSAESFVSVWLVDRIVKALAVVSRRAVTARAQESQDALESWRLCTQAALRCLQRVLLHLPDARRGSSTRQQRCMRRARQTAFCLLFQGTLDGVFHSTITPGVPAASANSCDLSAMPTLMQAYGERDWHWPSVSVFIECLHAWRLHDVLRRVFTDVYRRSERQWHTRRQHDKNKNDMEEALVTPRHWRTPLGLSTCRLVVQSSCDHDDPTTAALAVRHMLRSLLAVKHNGRDTDDMSGGDDGEPNIVTEGQSVAAWTRLIREDIIPRVNEVFCRTGTDTTQQWLGELDADDTAAGDIPIDASRNAATTNTASE